jgi:predicted alpha/beta-hydrolase family hydrolase
MRHKVRIKVENDKSVSGIIQIPDQAWCLMVLAHGAGAGMEHAFMRGVADRLYGEGIGTLRFNFLYMEQGGGRPDLPHVAHRVIRAAVNRANNYAGTRGVPVVGGGKSFGGRMFSEFMTKPEADGVKALVFYGFPLHAPGKTGTDRASHLPQIRVPMLFLQGTRDTLARIDLIKEVVKGLRHGTLWESEDADHGFHVPKRTGKTDEQVLDEMISSVVKWLRKKLA